MRPLFLAVMFLVVLAGSASAEIDHILIPYFSGSPLSGAFGSLWSTELAILNDSGETIVLWGYDERCPLSACVTTGATPPGITFYPSFPHRETLLNGVLLNVDPASAADRVMVKLRSRDISREDEGWGTEIPTITESGAPRSHFTILDVPTDSRYRVMLRVYQFHPEPISARVRFFSTPRHVSAPAFRGYPPDVLLAEETIAMTARRHVSTWERYPGYAEIQMLTQTHPELLQTERMRIEVTSLTEGVRLWGFVTITNNETQHVTVVSP